MRNLKVSISRNKREGYYAGYYPTCSIFGKGGHKRWDAFSMGESYPRIYGQIEYVMERERLAWNDMCRRNNEKYGAEYRRNLYAENGWEDLVVYD